MKACIYYKSVNKPWGGSNSFINALSNELMNNNQIEVKNRCGKDCDLVLLNSAYSAPGKYISTRQIRNIKSFGYSNYLEMLIKGKKDRKVRIVHRLDGIRGYYANIKTKMDDIQFKCLKLADFAVFQSSFSYKQFKEKGYNGSNYQIIPNGVNQDIFSLDNKSCWNGSGKLKIAASSWSKNSMKGHKTIAEYSKLDNVEVSFIGHWADDVNLENVKLLGPMIQQEIADVYRQNHIYLFPSKNESCPNSVLEAVSCGLPVLYDVSGGTPEVAERFGVPLTGNNKDDLNKIKENYASLLEDIKKYRNEYSIENVAKQYIEVFKKA